MKPFALPDTIEAIRRIAEDADETVAQRVIALESIQEFVKVKLHDLNWPEGSIELSEKRKKK